jgi:glycosyltransferase involved in cell wall biosynthesis
MANNLPQENEPVQPEVGDIFLGLDLSAHLFPEAENWLRDYRRRGVAIHFVVYDIIPLRNPQWTAPGMPDAFERWLLSIARQSTRLLCISATVAADVHEWLVQHAPEQPVPDIVSFPLGADLLPQSDSRTKADDPPLPDLQGRPVFLSVSTIEPRKGQAQTLAAFEQLWAEGQDVVLVLVGKVGWMMDEFVERLSHHPENGRHLFWLQGLSDTALEEVYDRSTALITASEAEGFGLPLIEAARHRLPIIARNIAVFREVAGRHAFYFSGLSAGCLARAIQYWQVLRQQQHHPASDGIRWLNWQQSAQHLQALLTSIKPVAGQPSFIQPS